MAIDPARVSSPSGLVVDLCANGTLRRIDFGAVLVNLFLGSALESGPANLTLRRRGASIEAVPLLGPESPARFAIDEHGLDATGEWAGLRFALTLRLAASAPAWFWHLTVENTSGAAQEVDLVATQDVGLAPYAAVRLNEYYVSHYIDHTPLVDARCGWTIASRQNLAAAGRHPWLLLGSLTGAVGFATDALQIYDVGAREPGIAPGLLRDLPGERRQHEHSLVALQSAPMSLAPGARGTTGFFGWVEADHPAASSLADLAVIDRVLALPESKAPALRTLAAHAPSRTLFAPARVLAVRDLAAGELGGNRRHEERDGDHLLAFFRDDTRHVVLRAKAQRVLRPHGHLLRTGTELAPDESALTSTVWMQGVFHSMLTQGHVAINRALSTTRGYLGLFRAHGQRVFVEQGGAWCLLDTPSAFEMGTHECVWTYRHAAGCVVVRASAGADRHEMMLRVDVEEGAAARLLVAFHVALDGDDASADGPPRLAWQGREIVVRPQPASDLGRRFAQGALRIAALDATAFESVGGDEALFEDHQSRRLPYVVAITAPARTVTIGLRMDLVTDGPDVPASAQDPAMRLPAVPALSHPTAAPVVQLGDVLPWYAHDALIHFLSPRGLEQFSGGGWGTRDVCQGPVELLLALDRPAPVRALLKRVFAAQNADGDWPQWFTFFERERAIRAGDSHGDIVFWPVLAVAQYVLATQDATLLDERVPFFDAPAATVRDHVERALQVIEHRRIPGTELAAFGHGDWNDALQPADPVLRERMSSAWTVTLHYQVLTTLAAAFDSLGRDDDAERFITAAARVHHDFQRRLMPDGVVTGYALFEADGSTRYLLHTRDDTTGVRYSLLPMIHAVIADLFTPEQAGAHLALIDAHLKGPDGARLFDKPLRYHGGLQKIFQRAETSAFFGREIGIMYMHAHLRYAEALARLGHADAFFDALSRAHPIGLRARVPAADLRQANCYYSSSDAAFFDRYQAYDEYARIAEGTVALDGGWRVYSSGPGIALGLVVRCLLGLRVERGCVVVDPVMPLSLDGLRATVPLAGRTVDVTYRVRAPYGPTALRVNGTPLTFERGVNAYRTGEARVALGDFAAACGAGERCELDVDVG